MSPTASIRKLHPSLGILGTGRMGVRLAAMFARAGRTVVLGSRDRARAEHIVASLGIPGLTGGTYREAAEATNVLPAAFIRDGLFDLLEEHRAALDGKTIIDITNPFNADYSDFVFACPLACAWAGGPVSPRPDDSVRACPGG